MAVVTVGVLREMPRKFVQNLKPNSKEPKKTTLMHECELGIHGHNLDSLTVGAKKIEGGIVECTH